MKVGNIIVNTLKNVLSKFIFCLGVKKKMNYNRFGLLNAEFKY